MVAYSQNQVVRGKVTSAIFSYPIEGVEVCINEQFHCITTDRGGEFLAMIDANIPIQSLTFRHEDYLSDTLYVNDDLPEYIHIAIQPKRSAFENGSIPPPSKRRGGFLSIGVDVANFDFSEFNSFFPDNFIDSLNDQSVRLAFGYDLIFNRTQVGLRIGFNPGDKTTETVDSLAIRTGDVMYELHGMYNLLRTEHFTCGPMLALKWYRHRMRVYSGKENLTLEDYLETRELDLRFNHLTAFAGVHGMLKMRGNKNRPSPQCIFGGNVGLLLPLHPDTWMRTGNHRIDAPADVRVPQLSFSVYLAIGSDTWYPKDVAP